MKRGTLYAWADAVVGKPVLPDAADHTWVTSYDAPYYGDPPAQEFWFCWGEVREAGPGLTPRLLSQTEADLSLAAEIGPPDHPIGDYGIRYGIHGVCHQMANRVLLASVEDQKPVVSDARLYLLSVLVFGVYGLNFEDWVAGPPFYETGANAE